MTDESEVEIIGSVDHATGPQNQNLLTDTEAIVEVSFQKNPCQEQKYLEAEPKALGLTQIMLSVFIVSAKIESLQEGWADLPYVIIGSFSLVSIIAGSVAIAAQNLQLSKLKACLGMQILTCILSVICFILTSGSFVSSNRFSPCYSMRYYNSSQSQTLLCDKLTAASDHFFGLEMLVQAAQLAISATLAAFCCKVIQCCSPRASVPVIVVSTPAQPPQ